MKKELEEAKNLDEFFSDMAEVFEVPKQKLKKMVSQFEDEPETVKKNISPRKERSTNNLPSTPAA